MLVPATAAAATEALKPISSDPPAKLIIIILNTHIANALHSNDCMAIVLFRTERKTHNKNNDNGTIKYLIFSPMDILAN